MKLQSCVRPPPPPQADQALPLHQSESPCSVTKTYYAQAEHQSELLGIALATCDLSFYALLPVGCFPMKTTPFLTLMVLNDVMQAAVPHRL